MQAAWHQHRKYMLHESQACLTIHRMREKTFNRLLRLIPVADIAAEFNISQPAVFQWRNNGIPSARAIRIEKMTNGMLTREELCPDFPWNG